MVGVLGKEGREKVCVGEGGGGEGEGGDGENERREGEEGVCLGGGGGGVVHVALEPDPRKNRKGESGKWGGVEVYTAEC